MKIPTNPMYDIDEHATVRLISTGEIIQEYINRHKRRAVKIRGLSHKPSSNPLDRLMLNTFKPLPKEHDSQWWSIKFIDGNKENLSIDNLEWDGTWYEPPVRTLGLNWNVSDWISVHQYPQLEMRLLPESAEIRSVKSKEMLVPFLDVSGYEAVRIPGLNYAPIHRLIALTLLRHPVDTDHLTVNHKDSNKRNNTTTNLEWATYQENNLHAFHQGRRGDGIRKIQMVDLETGTFIEFPGYHAAAKYLGVAPGSVHSVMDRRTYEGKAYKGHLLKYSDDPRTWVELKDSGPVEKRRDDRRIACRNMNTGEIVVYNRVTDVENAEGINRHTVFRLLLRNDLIPWRRKCLQVVSETGEMTWSDYPEEILAVYDDISVTSKPIMVTDKKGLVTYHPSITAWCEEDRENRCDPAVLSRRLKHTDRWHDWVFEMIDLRKYPRK